MHLGKVVIGNSLGSLAYAFFNDCYFIQNSNVAPFFYLKTDIPVFHTRNQREIWTKFRLMMSFLARAIVSPNLEKIRIKDKVISVSNGKHVTKYSFDKCYIFETSSVQHENEIETPAAPTYKVVDDLEVIRVGKKYKEIAPLYSRGPMATQMHFYTSSRVSGAKYVTDCVVESVLTRDQIFDFRFSDAMTKFIVERYLEKIGVRGKVVGRNKNGTRKYYKPEARHVKRIVIEEDNNKYRDSDHVKFLSMSLEEVINESTAQG